MPAVQPTIEHTRWLELFRYPRSLVAGCLTGLTQTGGVGLTLWMVTLFVMVLGITAPEASKLAIWVSLAAVAGRFFCSWISDAMGRRASGVLTCLLAALFMSLAGYLHSLFIGGVSLFFLLIVLQNFFGSGNYSIVGPYMGELWPSRLRGSGMGLVYGVGNLGKFIGPAGLALIAGSSNFVAPKATLDALVPAFNYFALWYVLGAVAFWLIGFETRGRSFAEIDAALAASVPASRAAPAARRIGLIYSDAAAQEWSCSSSPEPRLVRPSARPASSTKPVGSPTTTRVYRPMTSRAPGTPFASRSKGLVGAKLRLRQPHRQVVVADERNWETAPIAGRSRRNAPVEPHAHRAARSRHGCEAGSACGHIRS